MVNIQLLSKLDSILFNKSIKKLKLTDELLVSSGYFGNLFQANTSKNVLAKIAYALLNFPVL